MHILPAMAFPIDRVTSTNRALEANNARTPAQLAEELTFRNALAALQIEDSNSESSGSGSSNLFDPYASYIRLLAQNKEDAPAPAPGTPSVELSSIESRIASLNNNPGNLRFAHQTGATPGVGGFARFESPEAGYQALINQIHLDASRGYTLAQYITKYAPPSENDTALYIEQACRSLGIDANTSLANVDFRRLAAFQARKESGTIVG
jgi:hypothetical protein